MKYTQITNSFHGTKVMIRADLGDAVSKATLRRVRHALCGMADCSCGREDGSRDSGYYLEVNGYGPDAKILVRGELNA